MRVDLVFAIDFFMNSDEAIKYVLSKLIKLWGIMVELDVIIDLYSIWFRWECIDLTCYIVDLVPDFYFCLVYIILLVKSFEESICLTELFINQGCLQFLQLVLRLMIHIICKLSDYLFKVFLIFWNEPI